MNTIKFKEKEYPCKEMLVDLDGFKMRITVSIESLVDAFNQEHETVGTEANLIDDQIYFYLEDDQINLPEEKICSELLDEPMTFIE